jgi:Helicase HerA, central domain
MRVLERLYRTDWRPAPGPHRAWAFRGGAPPRDRAEEERFRERLRMALRVAVGIGARFAIGWTSGADGRVSLTASDAPSASWFRHVLAPIYGHDRWIPIVEDLTAPVSIARFGVLQGPVELPLPFAVDQPPWSEAVIQGLAATPPHIEILWSIEPRPVPAPLPLRTRPAPAPRGTSGLPMNPVLTNTERAWGDRAEQRRRAMAWRVEVALLVRPPVSPVRSTAVEQAARLLEATTRLEGGNGIRCVRPVRGIRTRPPALGFSEPELVGLFHTPWTPSARPRSEPPVGLPLGRGAAGIRAWLPLPVDEGRHVLVLGETGMGKSSLLIRLLAAATRKGSVILLDPIGDTGRRFLSALDAEARARTTWISPTECPIGLNALDPGPRDATSVGTEDRALTELVAVLRRVRHQRYLEGGFWGPRIEEVLHAALATASRLPNGTLLDASELLRDEGDPLASAVSGEARAAVHAFRAFVADHPEEIAGSRRVLGEIARSPVLRSALCRGGSSYRLAEALRPGAITVVTAEAGAIGESTARTLLGVYLALLWTDLLARERSSKTFLALDEAQWYAHESLLELLRLGRRCNVHVWTATQSLRSVPEELREALVTNSADLILFRGDPEQAREFGRWRPDLSIERLMGLRRGEAVALLGKGSDVRWVSTEPLPHETGGNAARAEIRSRSLGRWGEHAASSYGSAPGAIPLVSTVVARLRDRVHAARPGSVRIELEAVRREMSIAPEVLRQAGSELKRAGLLRRTQSTPRGTVWELGEPTGETLSPADRLGTPAPGADGTGVVPTAPSPSAEANTD